MELRHCRHHGLVEFARYGRPGPHQRWRCRRCVGEAVTRRHQKLRRTLIAEAGGRCVVCGYCACVINLHFHHVDPAAKGFGLTTATGRSLDKCRAEAKKCVLVCANCHGEIEMGLITSPPAGTTWQDRVPGPAPRDCSTAGTGTAAMMDDTNPNPDQEEFAEASLGEAQSENPPADPEMLEDEESSEGGTETYGGDPDEGATAADLDDPENADRDQAEG